MYRKGPIVNKQIARRQANRSMEIHYQKLRKMRSNLDTCSPYSYGILENRKAKKAQVQEDRYTEIERENRILLEKMQRIFRNKSPALPDINRSLSVETRRKEEERINYENLQMLKRLR